MYGTDMAEVGVAQLRRELKEWLERASSGEDVVVTDRGRPIARLVAVEGESVLDRLERDGVISGRPAGRPTAAGTRGVPTAGPVADLIVDDREQRR
jgi:prevent-host-death family protein